MYGRSTRTLFHVLAQTGFRKAEVALGAGEWDETRLSFENLKWKIGGKTVQAPTRHQLLSLTEEDFAIIMPPPSKADQWGRRWGNNPIWLPYDPSAAINAAAALAAWELCAAVPLERRAGTPLFCGKDGVGTPLRTKEIEATFDALLRSVVGAENAANYSMHSWRSYLASSMLAAGCSDAEIQAALRWASEDALKIYKVPNKELYGGWLRKAERERLTGERAVTLQADVRAMPIYEQEGQVQLWLDTGAALERTAGHADAHDAAVVGEHGVDGLIESMAALEA